MTPYSRAALVTVLLLAAVPAALAHAPDQAEGVLESADIPTAMVEVDGVPLFALRGVSAFPAEVRATRQADRIIQAARNPEVDPTRLEIVETERGTEIRSGDLDILALVVRYGLKLLRLFFEGIDKGTIGFEGFEAEWAWPTYKMVRVAIIAFSVVVAYPYIPGSGSEAFKGVSLFAGVMFSLGSTSAISNIIAGYTMTYRRAFRVGDRVRVGKVVGDVSDIRLQVTTLRTMKNEEVVVPNATILNNEIVNYSTLAASQGLILHTTVGIGYEVPWR